MSGNITLGGDLLVDKGEGCAVLGTGATATLITTSGTLSGTFANAPIGSVLSIPSCQGQSLAARILYTSNSVTATVVSGGTTFTTLSADPTTATTTEPCPDRHGDDRPRSMRGPRHDRVPRRDEADRRLHRATGHCLECDHRDGDLLRVIRGRRVSGRADRAVHALDRLEN